jgi:hypothetical protein
VQATRQLLTKHPAVRGDLQEVCAYQIVLILSFLVHQIMHALGGLHQKKRQVCMHAHCHHATRASPCLTHYILRIPSVISFCGSS